jgi:hypothetical protein
MSELQHDQAEIDALDGLKVPELRAACDQFGVDTEKGALKPQLITALLDDGVTADAIRKANESEKDAEDEEDFEDDEPEETAEPVEEEDLVLVRMIRANNTYQIRGYQFTALHPFSLVAEKDADYLIEHDGGFRMASPKEAKEFYS